MKILVTNDDGINASGLISLSTWANRRLGDVTVAAPKAEQSGKSHSIQLTGNIEAIRVDFTENIPAYRIDATPADCVRFCRLGLKHDYDIVFSGINRGFNIGSDIVYSGTVGAIFEAVMLGIPAVAFSTDHTDFEPAAQWLDTVWDYFEKYNLLSEHNLYNVNIPLNPRGIKITRQGGIFFSDNFVEVGEGLYRQVGCCAYEKGENLSLDTDAITAGYISVTPLTEIRTDLNMFSKLSGLIDN